MQRGLSTDAGALATTLGGVKLEPGRDYGVVTISFDKDDTPAIAKEKKVNYIKAAGASIPGRRLEISDRRRRKHRSDNKSRGV